MEYNEITGNTMNENRFTTEQLTNNLLIHIEHSLSTIHQSGLADDIEVSIYKTHLDTLKTKILAGRITYKDAEQAWHEIDNDVNQVISNRQYTQKESEKDQTKPWWRKLF